MTTQSPTLVRCERCRAVISSAEATDMIRHGVPCGVCGGTLTLCNGHRRRPADPDARPPSAERRLLGVLRKADGRPVGLHAIIEAGIDDPANAIYELERAGHRIEREYAEVTTGRRRLLGYRLRRPRPIT
jgi:Helix-turn-helix domain